MLLLEPNECLIPLGIEIYLLSTPDWQDWQAECIFSHFKLHFLLLTFVDFPMDMPQHLCHGCNQLKLLSEFKLHKKDDQYGKKGGPTNKCTQCTLYGQQSHQKNKRKCADDGTEALHTNNPMLPFDQFTALLANWAPDGSLCCCTCVTTEGMVGDAKEIANIIAGHVWEATRYRFTLVDPEYNVGCIGCWQLVL